MAAVEKNEESLRTRQKTRRREAILKCARDLFEQRGYDATTMAAIAEAAEVSPPTVFNYFGSKNALIVELVLKGHEAGRAALRDWRPDPDWSLGEMMAELMCFYTDATMEIAGKRIWRYAEATNIRRSDSDVSDLYDQIEANHVGEVERFIYTYAADDDLSRARCALLARVAYQYWNGLFFRFIRNDAMPITTFKAEIRQQFKALAGMISLAPRRD